MRKFKLSIYHKINLLIFLLAGCAIVLYSYSINNSLKIVQSDIQKNNLNQNIYLANQLDQNIDQLSMIATALNQDSTINQLSSVDLMDMYQQVGLKRNIAEKLKLQSLSTGWNNTISIYSNLLDEWIVRDTWDPSPTVDSEKVNQAWSIEKNHFVRYSSFPFLAEASQRRFVMRISFPVQNMVALLNDAKQGTTSDPFFYHPSDQMILNSSSDTLLTKSIIARLGDLSGMTGTKIINIQQQNFLVNYVKSRSLGWYLVDFISLQEALLPIQNTKIIFYFACLILVLSGVTTSFLLYRKIQIPIKELTRGARSIKEGDFSARVRKTDMDEFTFLHNNFNDMAEQIQQLIENVYTEKIISRESLFKQLQAQINPHFLYNCLFFINNMVRLGNYDAITAMTKNLAEYFRYTTRVEQSIITLQSELKVTINYLNIQKMRMPRIHFEIDIPEAMQNLSVPRLILQPLVENSVVHGIEQKRDSGHIRIWGERDKETCYLYVEDDGKGMTTDEIAELKLKLNDSLKEEMGCALWNITQRLKIQFGEEAGVQISNSLSGGLMVCVSWDVIKEEKNFVQLADRR
ncbi:MULTISPECIES: histidine kinase [unclassified Paenibacillus]|uniref:sensor histidine kinase n=1 Tax=unclassified Paenibacillus TaxID=185978 RepID=UPI002406148F|nr:MULTISPECIES: histidine kinase [unclassified Paenibacillus]MDF9839519.1 two-component system sensor histidine kinase YesM [Paenibacillus sp. PastF-2]MDF9846100.1 two-component system sensor histidine kinase YesM [Paenibacillus sp. PastM-2]MDF9852673.1 two-component system sensor histidine kinase YesM [Paenibacillus sp. PastF-1]MDH6477596.1 two-component system sensor histidine kinase YesM [Paenibacillus sp. PastH-2]MDH6505339.1 two-component system sensor histidine kinase YesM [Paenibacillu